MLAYSFVQSDITAHTEKKKEHWLWANRLAKCESKTTLQVVHDGPSPSVSSCLVDRITSTAVGNSIADRCAEIKTVAVPRILDQQKRYKVKVGYLL